MNGKDSSLHDNATTMQWCDNDENSEHLSPNAKRPRDSISSLFPINNMSTMPTMRQSTMDGFLLTTLKTKSIVVSGQENAGISTPDRPKRRGLFERLAHKKQLVDAYPQQPKKLSTAFQDLSNKRSRKLNYDDYDGCSPKSRHASTAFVSESKKNILQHSQKPQRPHPLYHQQQQQQQQQQQNNRRRSISLQQHPIHLKLEDEVDIVVGNADEGEELPMADSESVSKWKDLKVVKNDVQIPVACLVRAQSSSVLNSNNCYSPDGLEEYSLKTVEKPQIVHRAFRSIAGETLSQLLMSMSAEQFLCRFFLVDCRYPYEYQGGHIRNAVNMFELSKVEDMFFPADPERFNEVRTRIPIFYCEYSQKRGPKMAMELRKFDRTINQYPHLNYEEIYILDRGYQKFFAEFMALELCEPSHYIPMDSDKHIADLKTYNAHKNRTRNPVAKQNSDAFLMKTNRLRFS